MSMLSKAGSRGLCPPSWREGRPGRVLLGGPPLEPHLAGQPQGKGVFCSSLHGEKVNVGSTSRVDLSGMRTLEEEGQREQRPGLPVRGDPLFSATSPSKGMGELKAGGDSGSQEILKLISWLAPCYQQETEGRGREAAGSGGPGHPDLVYL